MDPGTVFTSGRTLAPRMTQKTTHASWFQPPAVHQHSTQESRPCVLLAAIPSQSCSTHSAPSHSAGGPERGCAPLQALPSTDFIKRGGKVTLPFLVPRGGELKLQPALIFRGLLSKRMLLFGDIMAKAILGIPRQAMPSP